MDKKKLKKIFSVVFPVLVFALTLWSVFKGEDLNQMVSFLKGADHRFVLPGILCVILFIVGESVIIHYLFKSLGTKTKFGHCCLYSFIGYFYSCITPSASGGQPMQLVYMRRDKLPVATSTMVLAIITIAYKLALVIPGFLILVIRPGWLIPCIDGAEWLLWIGFALNIICISALLLVVFTPAFVKKLTDWALRLAKKLRICKDPEAWEEKLDGIIDQYYGASDYFRNHKLVIVNAILMTMVQRGILFLISWLTYKSFGLSGFSLGQILLLHTLVCLGSDILPLPGGMGANENLFLVLFEQVFGEALVLSGMVISRGISFYAQLFVSAIVTVAAAFIIKKRDR